MPIYKYKAKNLNGKRVQDLINAFNERAAIEKLQKRGLKNISVVNKSDSLELKILSTLNPVKIKDLVIFFRQFSVMISASLPLVQSLKVAGEQTKNITLKMVISEIAQEVDGGSRLSEAMAKRTKVFPQFYVSVVKSGETSGRLDEVLNYLADEMERNYDMISKVKGAMIYPAVVFLGLLGVGILMMVVVVPQITSILMSTNADLPMATRIVIAISEFLTNFWWLVLVIVAGLIGGLKVASRNKATKGYVDYLKLRLPVFGKLYQYIYLVRFSRSIKTLVMGGVQITHSLEIVAEIVDNKIYQNVLLEATEAVKGGNTISSVFLKNETIPAMVAHMISVGERSGKLSLVLEKISDFYDRELSNLTSNLMSLLEPLIVIVMGIGVGIMVAAVILPMYNAATQF